MPELAEAVPLDEQLEAFLEANVKHCETIPVFRGLDLVGTFWNMGFSVFIGQLGVLKCFRNDLRDARSARSCFVLSHLSSKVLSEFI